MNRRNFLKNGSLAGLSLSIATLPGCTDVTNDESRKIAATNEFDLNEITIDGLRDKMASGELKSFSITQKYLSRIEALDKNGPVLRSVIEVNPDALTIASQLDEERKNGKIRGPLHGIPVLIKDNIDTADKMQTTAGSLALEGNIASKDAFLVKKLRDAGAVILGKTNLSEWANFRSSKSCSGWSSRGGQTKSPYLLSHNPCGSSSGSGVAIAANLCAIAVGTETDGSIVCPSAVNGIVGIKPTVGLVSRSGIIPISHTQDTAGPMCRTVRDAAILLGILAGRDDEDEATHDNQGKVHADYTTFLKANALQGKRIGIEKKLPGENQFIHSLLQKCRDLLQQRGATIIEIEYLDKISQMGDHEFAVLKYEFRHGVNKYLSTANARVRSLKEVIDFNKANEDKAMPFFKQDTLEACEKLGGLDSPEYKESLAKSNTGSRKIIDEVMKDNRLDAICGITMGPSCSIDRWYGDRWGDVFLTMPAAVSGYPHITVPAGLVYGLPVGLSFFGGPYTEPQLIAMSYDFEQAAKSRILPQFRQQFEG
jgi:amidase